MPLRTRTSSKALRLASAAGLALSLSLSACSVGGGQGASAPAAAPRPAEVTYGHAAGTGQKVETATGPYETLTAAASSNLINFEYASTLMGTAWTKEDGAAAQKVAVDFVFKEFLDSTTLEGGPAEFEAWRLSDGKKYLTEPMSEAAAAPDAQGLVLSNAKGKALLPVLIHDGKPRVSSVTLTMSSFGPATPESGLSFNFDYGADYRVSDAEAGAFVGAQFTGQSGADFINSDRAKPQLRDGVGENIYRGYGHVNITLDKDETGAMRITSAVSSAKFNTDDFTF